MGEAANSALRLQLFVLAYNLANFLRRLALPSSIRHWPLTTRREKLVKPPSPFEAGYGGLSGPLAASHVPDAEGRRA